MFTNKHAAQSLEQQHLKSVRKYYLSIADINIKLSKIHQQIKPTIDVNKYKYATDYIHQYISYTTVWQLKFVLNLESPEVALLQIFHLNYIFQHEPTDAFLAERNELQEIAQYFYSLKPFKDDHMERRLQAMLDYIQQQQREH